MEIHPADSGARRRAAAWIAVAAVAGGGTIAAANRFEPAMVEWVRADLPARFRLVTAVIALLAAGPPFAAGIYMWRLGDRTVRGERFPPVGTAMIHDTVVLTGNAARQRGRLLQACGAIIAFAAIAIVVVLVRLVLVLEARAYGPRAVLPRSATPLSAGPVTRPEERETA